MALTDTLISEYQQLLEELTESRRPSSRENRAARDIATRWHTLLQGDRMASRLTDVLDEIEEYLDRHQDVLDGEDNRPRPNKAMSLLTRLQEARR